MLNINIGKYLPAMSLSRWGIWGFKKEDRQRNRQYVTISPAKFGKLTTYMSYEYP